MLKLAANNKQIDYDSFIPKLQVYKIKFMITFRAELHHAVASDCQLEDSGSLKTRLSPDRWLWRLLTPFSRAWSLGSPTASSPILSHVSEDMSVPIQAHLSAHRLNL